MKYLRSLLLAAALLFAPATLKSEPPFYWRCTEFYRASVPGGTLIAFKLEGLGKWQLFGVTPDWQYVCEARGEITPAGNEVVLVVPDDGCTSFFLRIMDVDGWPNKHIGPFGDK